MVLHCTNDVVDCCDTNNNKLLINAMTGKLNKILSTNTTA